MTREQRERMTETFASVRDAVRDGLYPLFALTVEPAVRFQKMPDLPRPWYLPATPPQTVGQYRAALARLGRLGIVKERAN